MQEYIEALEKAIGYEEEKVEELKLEVEQAWQMGKSDNALYGEAKIREIEENEAELGKMITMLK